MTRFHVKSKSTILMQLSMKVKSSSFKSVDMSKVIKKTIRMEGKMLTKRIRRMRRIRTTKINQEKNMYNLKRKEILMKRRKSNKTKIKLMKVNSHLSNKSNKTHHLKSYHLNNPPPLMYQHKSHFKLQWNNKCLSQESKSQKKSMKFTTKKVI